MTVAGWITMSIALVAVWSLVIWCYSKILRAPKEGDLSAGSGD